MITCNVALRGANCPQPYRRTLPLPARQLRGGGGGARLELVACSAPSPSAGEGRSNSPPRRRGWQVASGAAGSPCGAPGTFSWQSASAAAGSWPARSGASRGHRGSEGIGGQRASSGVRGHRGVGAFSLGLTLSSPDAHSTCRAPTTRSRHQYRRVVCAACSLGSFALWG